MTAVHIFRAASPCGLAALPGGGLSHSYDKTLALTDINLEIAAGATVGLIGPDGVGLPQAPSRPLGVQP